MSRFLVVIVCLTFSGMAFSAEPKTYSSSDFSVSDFYANPVTNWTPQLLNIRCQNGSVEFDMKTGEAVYKDCTPNEAARSLFDAFSSDIRKACLIQVEPKAGK